MRHLHRDRAAARRQGPHDAAGGRARARASTSRVRWGTGYDTELRSFVNVIATPKGGTHVSGFEQAVTKTFNDVMRAAEGAQGQRRRRHQGRRARGPDRGGHRPARRAAVRGPDQGDPRHAGRAQRRAQGGLGRAEEVPDLHQAGREGPGQAGDGEGRRARPRPGSRPASTRRPSAARTRWSPPRCPPSSPTAAPPTSSAPSCSSSRATRRWAPPRLARNSRVPGAAADPRQDPQRPEGLGRRHAQERRVRLDHPGRRRRLRPDVRPRGARATAGSSSWPTPTPTAPTSAACWRRCSSSTCPS